MGSAMSSDATPLTAWATGTNDTWPQLQKGFKHLSVEYATLSDRSTQSVTLFTGFLEVECLVHVVVCCFTMFLKGSTAHFMCDSQLIFWLSLKWKMVLIHP